MKKETLKKILSNHYSKDGIKSILCGRMKPSYEVMLKLNELHKIPFTAWKDIKFYISNSNDTTTKDKITRA
jgi:hypothetical protein